MWLGEWGFGEEPIMRYVGWGWVSAGMAVAVGVVWRLTGKWECMLVDVRSGHGGEMDCGR
jgi:hypothetical protein